MGFLDHTTNNIIVDAVLTDKGRQKLASASGLNIKTYAFADTEVDYTLLKKYGEIVGKEKIEKNTPIFEANTGDSIGSRHSLLTDSSTGEIEEILVVENSTSGATETKFDVTFRGYPENANINYSIFYSYGAWTPTVPSPQNILNINDTLREAKAFPVLVADTQDATTGTYGTTITITMTHTTTTGSYIGSFQVVQANSFSSAINRKSFTVS